MAEPEHLAAGRLHEHALAVLAEVAHETADEEAAFECIADTASEGEAAGRAVEDGLGGILGSGEVLVAEGGIQRQAGLLGGRGEGRKRHGESEERRARAHWLSPRPLRAISGRIRPLPYSSSRPGDPRSSAVCSMA